MLLRRVELSNVGLYAGAQSLEFSQDERRPVTLIGGRNGAGKTTLLNAMPLVLYGNRAKGILGTSAYPEYLQRLIHQDCAKASVTLEFERRENGKRVRYVVEREWSRSPNGKSSENLFVSVDEKARPDLEANWPEFVEGIMPLSVSGLAIFDGEKIEALADVTNSADVLRTSLYGLLGLDLVDRLQKDLVEYRRKAAHRILPNQKALASALREAEDRLAVTLADADGFQSELRSAERALELATAELDTARDHLQGAGGDRFAARERLHAELVGAQTSSESGQRSLENLLAGDLPLLQVRGLLQQAVNMGERAKVASEAALVFARMKERDEQIVEQARVSPSFTVDAVAALEEMLDAGRKIYEVGRAQGFEVSEEATSAARRLLGDVGTEIEQDTVRLVSQITSASVTAELARRSLEAVPSGDAFEAVVRTVADAEARVRSSAADLAVAVERVAEGDKKVLTAQREVDRVASQVLEAGVGDSDSARISREVDGAEVTLSRFAARVVARNVDRISANITQALRDLLRKETLISRLVIDPESLEISLFGRNNRLLDPSRLSAGERQMLATAVLWGLSKSTGRTLPTIIDTPVGRLDRSHRTNLVSRYFPAAARQVVLLSTDEEIVGDYLRQLNPYVGCSYLLDYDTTRDATTIREGYFA